RRRELRARDATFMRLLPELSDREVAAHDLLAGREQERIGSVHGGEGCAVSASKNFAELRIGGLDGRARFGRWVFGGGSRYGRRGNDAQHRNDRGDELHRILLFCQPRERAVAREILYRKSSIGKPCWPSSRAF